MEEGVVAPLSIPMGDGYREGNAQFLYLNGRTRTFIGNSKVTALHKDINGDDDQELLRNLMPLEMTLDLMGFQRMSTVSVHPAGT